MTLLKGLQRTVLWSAAALLVFGAMPAKAISNTAFGVCTGSDISGGGGSDCVTALGHISASVVGTLTINEQRAISFGNFAVDCGGGCLGDATLDLDVLGNRTSTAGANDTILLLYGANNGGTGPGGLDTGSQSPGHYTVETGAEGATSQVYISFADTAGNIVDACSPGATSTGGVHAGTYAGVGTCDNYHPGASITLTGPGGATFTVDHFVFNESGSDVYGHYIDNSGAAVGPGSPSPFLHDRTHPVAAAGTVDVVVGGTLHTVAAATYLPGKYTGTFDVMVSY